MTKKPAKRKLPAPPNKPSVLIRMALRDLTKTERQKTIYKVSMGFWRSSQRTKCHVCFAGAVMAQTLKVPVSTEVDLLKAEFGTRWAKRLGALDCLRKGEIDRATYSWAACELPSTEEDKYLENGYSPTYEGNKEGFKKAMLRLAKVYEKLGK